MKDENNWNPNEYQGKSKKQVENSAAIMVWCIIAFGAGVVAFALYSGFKVVIDLIIGLF
ncbi:unnamed protein product [marine sediment metagenome]|uniref:Uncharacterized protein n=1 Tax=marine sediment metagenome TaxID=412755 RepID=X0UWL4_9ZZZZ